MLATSALAAAAAEDIGGLEAALLEAQGFAGEASTAVSGALAAQAALTPEIQSLDATIAALNLLELET